MEHSTRIDKLNEIVYTKKEEEEGTIVLLDIRAPCHTCYKENK